MIKIWYKDEAGMRDRPPRHRAACALFAIGLMLSVAACATPTPYAPAASEADGEGYVTYPLEENRYRVIFSGNAVTSRETVENYLLYRAAEITLESGHDHFRVVDQATDVSTSYRTTFSGTSGFWPYSYSDRFYMVGPGFTAAQSRPITRYRAAMEIVVAPGDKPEGDIRAYAARDVIETLAPTIVRPGDPEAE